MTNNVPVPPIVIEIKMLKMGKKKKLLKSYTPCDNNQSEKIRMSPKGCEDHVIVKYSGGFKSVFGADFSPLVR